MDNEEFSADQPCHDSSEASGLNCKSEVIGSIPVGDFCLESFDCETLLHNTHLNKKIIKIILEK
jgi:hypothetical protein